MATNTATTSVTHTGNGSTNAFAIPFSFLADSEVDVTVAGVLKTINTHYTISGSTVTFTSGNTPANGAAVKFQRDTDISAKKVDFSDGSVLTEADLDTNSDQVIFAQQEITDKLNGIEDGATADQTVTEIKSLIAGSPLGTTHIADDAVTNAKIAPLSVGTNEIGGGQVTEAKLAASSVTTTRIADDAVTNAKIAPLAVGTNEIGGATISTAKLQDGAVTTAKIADNSINSDKIAENAVTIVELAANSVDSSELVDGSVDHSHLSNDCVDGDNIQDDSINSEHYVDGSIDEAHIANNAVTTNKIADAELKTLAGMQSGTASKLADSTALTSDIADLNQLDGMQKATTITDDDTKFPTSGAIVDYVAAQLAPIGGLEAIANENSFPNTQPQSGVVISIADAGGLAVSSTGTASGQTVGGTTVNISGIATNFRGSSISAGVRLLVVSTGAGQNYTYHKATLREDDLVGLSGDINDFAERYRVGSSNPTTNNDAGDLFFNTSTGKLMVYNGTTSAWEEAQSVGNFFISTLSPAFDGSTTNFTITNAPTNAQQILLIIEGVIQKPNAGTSTPTEGFALDSSTVKLAAAPAIGASYHAVVMGSTVNIGTPSDNTVTTAILQNNSVSTGKIQDASITQGKLATDSVSTAKILNSAVDSTKLAINSVITSKIADDAVNAAKIADGAIDNSAKIGGNIINNTHMADNAINTNEIVNDAVTSAKIADNAVTNAKINGMAASKLTGALPAIDGSNLTGIASAGQARNFFINGAMQVNQRQQTGTLGYFNPVTASIYTLDRWRFAVGSSFDTNSARITQDTASPNGFSNSWKIDIYNTQTPTGSENAGVEQRIEAQDLQGLAYGTSDAKTMTLSFYVKSYKTGTYCVQIMQEDGSKYQLHEYTINQSNTWEKKTITIVGNTSDSIHNNIGIGIRVIWALACGSGDHVSATSSWVSGGSFKATSNQVNLWDNGSNDWFLTGCQLEVGSTATDYAHETFAETIQKCFKYFYKTYDYDTAIGTATSVGAFVYSLPTSQTYAAMPSVRYPVEMRNNPTVTAYSTQNANTTGKMSADSADKSTAITYIGRKGHFPFVNNSSSGISVNVWLRHHFTAESEL
ncbi:hypothetical protein PSCSP2_00031 [Prochlorococcus phage P-SCSP2]|nr:hypothetical protein PSCSP2_00031 [Prochlorococcus phage P-SCSP2]